MEHIIIEADSRIYESNMDTTSNMIEEKIKVTFVNGQVYWFESVDSLFKFVASCDIDALSWEVWKGGERYV